jgi:hypothetical protein
MTVCNASTSGFVASKTGRISVPPTAVLVGMIGSNKGNNASSNDAIQSARQSLVVAIIAARPVVAIIAASSLI